MEWAMKNPGHLIFYIVMILALLVSFLSDRRSKRRNESLSCAKCGQQFKDNNYHAYRLNNYCDSCISLMRSNAKKGVVLILVMTALGLIASLLGLLQDYLRGFSNSNAIYSWMKTFGEGVLIFGGVLYIAGRDYNELKKADEDLHSAGHD